MCKNVRYFQGFGRAITIDFEGFQKAYYEDKPSLLCNEEELNGVDLHRGLNSNNEEWNEVSK